MRSTIAGPVAALLGSLGLHGGVLLGLLIAVYRPADRPRLNRPLPDAWVGNAVEVDAVGTSDENPTLPSGAPAVARAETAQAPRPTNAASMPAPAMQPEEAPADRAKPTSRPSTGRPRIARVPRAGTFTPGANAPPAAAAEASRTSGAAPATGPFGSQGLPPGVRNLSSAFTRAITPATAADPIWQTLPIGSERPFTIAITVDASGHVSSAEILKERDGSAPEIQAAHLRERVVALLGAGLFALQDDVGAGRELFRITITLSDRPLRDQEDEAQRLERGFDPPRGTSPGRAYFTLISGRHFEAKVQVLAH